MKLIKAAANEKSTSKVTTTRFILQIKRHLRLNVSACFYYGGEGEIRNQRRQNQGN
jgi:hypothetical protein